MAKPDLSRLSAKRKTDGNAKLKQLLSLGEVEEVDIDLVDPDPTQPRPRDEVMEGIEEFADDLERDNFVLAQLPVFHKTPNGRYRIVVGERRYTGFKLKGRKKIPAITKVWTEEEQRQIFILQYVENDDRLKKHLSPIADARWWRAYIDRYHGGNISDAAKARGRTVADISNRLALLDAPAAIQAFAKKTKLKDSATLATLSRIHKRGGEAVVNQVIKDYESGAIGGGFRSYVEVIAKELKTPEKKEAEQSDGEKPSKQIIQQPEVKAKKKETSAGDKPVKSEEVVMIEKALDAAKRALFNAKLTGTKNDIQVYDTLLADLKESVSLLQKSSKAYLAERTKFLAKGK